MIFTFYSRKIGKLQISFQNVNSFSEMTERETKILNEIAESNKYTFTFNESKNSKLPFIIFHKEN